MVRRTRYARAVQLSTAADLLLAGTALAYAGASGLFFARIARRGHTDRPRGASEPPPRTTEDTLGRRAEAVFALGALLHFMYFMLTAASVKACPVEGIQQAASLTGLVATTVFLFVSRAKRLDAVGAFVAPVSLGALLAARFLGGGPGVPLVKSAVLPFHVTAILVASALFAVSSALAATYLVQEKQLKQKRALGATRGLPPLEVLERASHRFLLAGFPLLTLGILTGLLFVGKLGETLGRAQLLRQVLAYAAWVCFAAVLFMRSAGGWRGRRAAWGTLFGFGCAVLVFLVYLVRDRVGRG